jgi:hypothetical protein
VDNHTAVNPARPGQADHPEVVGEGLEDGQVGSADQLAVLGGDAVERAVAEPDGAVGVVGRLVAAGGQRLAEGGKGLIGVGAGR